MGKLDIIYGGQCMNRYDVIISGGGPVGSLGALLLAEQGFKVALIEESKLLTGEKFGKFFSGL